MLYSHESVLLTDHLMKSNEIASRIWLEKNNLKINYSKEELEKIISNILQYHDLGKATSFFQQYLIASINNEKSGLKHEKLRRHSLVSAVYAAYKTYLDLAQSTNREKLAAFVFIAISRHHGNLEKFDDMSFITKTDWNFLEQQYNDINFDELKIERFLFSDIKDFHEDKICDMTFNQSIDDYLLMNFIFSLTVYADKNEAAKTIFDNKISLNDIASIVDYYKTEKFSNKDQTELNKTRENVYQSCEENIVDNLHEKIFSINVPTGSGKTLTVLNAALKMIKKDNSINRIIYALPFTSIIDQTKDILNEIFSLQDLNPDNYLLLHHHLAEAEIVNDEEYIEGAAAQFLIENWDKPIILTTFWQLFNTIISNKNKSLRKFHNLTNSIIVFDEIQTVPMEYWSLINVLFKKVVELFNSRIIFLTATMPLIFHEDLNEIFPLIAKKDRDITFNSFSRYNCTIVNDLEPLAINEFAELVLDHINAERSKSFLFVLNTIQSSLDLYMLLKDNIDKNEMIYLSTNLIPVDRLKKINKIKEEKGRKIVISTQLIEAGVDIDLDVVYRDFAPFDSLVQSAGRCNRNNGVNKGKFYVMQLMNAQNKKRYCNYIYSTKSMIATETLLKKRNTFPEKELVCVIDDYYKMIKEMGSDDISKKIIQGMIELNYKIISDDFKLINDDIPDVQVFVEKDELASFVFKEFLDIIHIPDKVEKKDRFLKIRKDFYNYCLSLKISKSNYSLLQSFPEIGDMKYISRDMLESFYSDKIGFKKDFENFI